MPARNQIRPWFTGVLVLSAASSIAAPRLSYVYPIGQERGKTITLSIVGTGLDGDIEVLSNIPGSLQLKPVEVVDGKPAYAADQRRDVELKIAPDAPVGIYPVRVRTQDGVSNHVLFSVGSLPDVGEVEPNNLPAQAQPIEMNRTIAGSVFPADRDVYKITLPAGARLVAEIEAKRIGMAMDSAIEVLDAAGHELSANDDAQGLDGDSRVDVTIAKAGDYFLSVHDVNFQASASYRLKVGSFDYADGIFPLGGGGAAGAKVWGWKSSGEGVGPAVVATSEASPWTMVQPMGADSPTLPFRFIVSDGPEIVEAEGSLELAAGQTLNGRLAAHGEKDRVRLAVAPGQRWRIRLASASLGCPLDGVISLENAAKNVLARSDDSAGLDPVLDYAVPEGVQEVFIVVEDLQGRGGPGYAYRLSAELLGIDFALEVVPDVVNIPLGSFEVVNVRVERKGYDGPIQLFVPEEVTGIVAEGGEIAAGQNEGYLVLSSATGAPQLVDLQIWGRGGTPARPIVRQARGSATNRSPVVAAKLLDPMPSAICRAKPLGVEVSTRKLRVPHGLEAKVDVTLKRGEGISEAVQIVPRQRIPSFPQGLEVTIAKDQSAGAIQFPPNTELGLSKGTMLFDAVTTLGGREIRVTLPPIFVDVVRPFNVEVPNRRVTMAPTGSYELETLVRRVAPFADEVRLDVSDLPKGMTAESVTVPGDRSAGLLILKSQDTPAGEYTIKIVGAADIAGRKRTKDYLSPAQEVVIVVAPKG